MIFRPALLMVQIPQCLRLCVHGCTIRGVQIPLTMVDLEKQKATLPFCVRSMCYDQVYGGAIFRCSHCTLPTQPHTHTGKCTRTITLMDKRTDEPDRSSWADRNSFGGLEIGKARHSAVVLTLNHESGPVFISLNQPGDSNLFLFVCLPVGCGRIHRT